METNRQMEMETLMHQLIDTFQTNHVIRSVNEARRRMTRESDHSGFSKGGEEDGRCGDGGGGNDACGGGESFGGGNGSDSNPGLMNSWETTMFSLARELETICSRGSSPRDSPTISPCVTPTNGVTVITPPSNRRTFSLASSSSSSSSTIITRLPHQGSLCEAGGWVGSPCVAAAAAASGAPSPPLFPTPAGVKVIRVRHEETEDRLDRSLTMICHRQNSNNSPVTTTTGNCDDDDDCDGGNAEQRRRSSGKKVQSSCRSSSSSSKLVHRNSSKFGMKFRLDLGGKDPDDIMVSMNTEDHILRVYCDGEVIHLLQLAENTDPQTLSCLILDGRMLFIKQRSKETMCLEYEEGCSEINLPITRHDESKLVTTVNLRLPAEISPEEVTIKTIDDTLMIRTGPPPPSAAAGPGGAPPSPSTGAPATVGGAGCSSDAARFCLALNLPDGTDSRTVSAWMSKGHLIVKGRLMPTSRRMTCTF